MCELLTHLPIVGTCGVIALLAGPLARLPINLGAWLLEWLCRPTRAGDPSLTLNACCRTSSGDTIPSSEELSMVSPELAAKVSATGDAAVAPLLAAVNPDVAAAELPPCGALGVVAELGLRVHR